LSLKNKRKSNRLLKTTKKLQLENIHLKIKRTKITLKTYLK
jgi:hypothetical protein